MDDEERDLGPYRGQWGYPLEELEEGVLEGEFREVPPKVGGGPGVMRESGPKESPGWWARRKKGKEAEEAEFLKGMQEEALGRGYPVPTTYKEAVGYKEKVEKVVGEKVRLSEMERRATEEFLKAKEREFRGKYRKGPPIKKAWGVTKELLGPRAPLVGKGFYIPKPQKELYVPRPREEWYPPGPTSSIAEVQKPNLELLRREGALPVRGIQRPSPGLARQEGLGSALARLRKASIMPLTRVENAALAEIRSNGDVDNLQHIVSELSQLGISRAEAEGAVRSLLKRGLVRGVVESRGEKPVYEVV